VRYRHRLGRQVVAGADQAQPARLRDVEIDGGVGAATAQVVRAQEVVRAERGEAAPAEVVVPDADVVQHWLEELVLGRGLGSDPQPEAMSSRHCWAWAGHLLYAALTKWMAASRVLARVQKSVIAQRLLYR
jgi:hypothetical protein